MNKYIKKIGKAMAINVAVLSSLAVIVYNKDFKVNTYEMTNGNKTIIFQEMVHVADADFYNSVNKDIVNYKKEGYTLFYEMIKINNDEEMKKLTSLIGLNSPIFTEILESTQLENQKDHMLKIEKEDVHADIDSKELIERLEGHYTVNKIDPTSLSIEDFSINYFPENETLRKNFSRNFMKIGLWVNFALRLDPTNSNDVIIKQRNDVLISKIYNSGKDKIYIQYGAFHFKDFETQLEKQGFKTRLIESKTVFE